MGNILLIDNDQKNLEDSARLLELANYIVYRATDGKQGLELACKHDPDLILCGTRVPVLDGYGILRAVTNNHLFKGTSFVLISDKLDESDLRYGMDLGADDYLFRPYTGDRLLSLVATRIKKAQELKRAFKNSPLELSCSIDDTPLHCVKGVFEKFTFKTLKKKEPIFMEGEDSNYIFYVSKGCIKTYITNEAGKEYITKICIPGDFFGYNTFCEDSVHTESAEAIENSQIAYLEKKQFLNLLQSNPALSEKFIRYVSDTLRETKDTLARLAYNSARKRVAEAILYIARYCKHESQEQFVMNRNDISAVSAVSPESVSRHLTDFKSNKLIEIEKGVLTIKDTKRLESLKN